jgi:hypothetical protein
MRWCVRAAVTVAVALCVWAAAPAAARQPASLPDRLSDRDFWRLSQESSEPGGYFRSADITNLTSNELYSQHVLPDLVARAPQGGVYLGVGPEQNFTYMTSLRPKMAIIFDIRRGNLDLHLMYKALFELANDRADFVSLLFAKPRPAGLGPSSTVDEIFAAFARSDSSRPLYEKTRAAITARLTTTRALPVPARDLAGIETVYEAFYASGFYLRASPSYWDLMTATDRAGVARSYLATEASFAWLKDLQSRNLVVPVVGDFAGPKAIRAIGAWLAARGAAVSAFYLSNVEQYLVQDGKWDAFCRNVRMLPLHPAATFIRSESGRGGGRGGGFVNYLAAIASDVRDCAEQKRREVHP